MKKILLFIVVVAFSSIKAQTITDADGNVYNTVAIGTQLWMKENLKTTKYRDGSSIPNVTGQSTWNGLTTGAYCNYDNVSSNANIWGRLYNWYAVSDPRELCPIGWHVSSDYDIDILYNYLLVNGYNYDGSTTGNKMAKSLASTTHWAASLTVGAVGNTDYPSVRNSTGFTALPSGFRDTGFKEMGRDARFYSSSAPNGTNPNYFNLYFANALFWRNFAYKYAGFAVRCICDMPISINETKSSDNIILYPNPTTDFIVIDGLKNNNVIEVVNIQGQIVKNLNVSSTKTTIDVSEFPNGIYIVKIKSEQELFVTKFLKQ